MKKNITCSWVIGAALVMGFVLAGCESSPPVSEPVDLTRVTSYYVRANGNDINAGTSEAMPFKTLSRAVEAASGSTVKTITVTGTLASALPNITNGTGAEEILITGKADAAANDKAVLQIPAEGEAFTIGGASRIRFEHITITGGEMGGIEVNEGATVTLGQGAVVSGNSRKYGGGIKVSKGTLVLQGNALVTKNSANAGGGIAVLGSGTILMKDNALVSENEASTNDEGKDGEGGGVYAEAAEITMEGNAAIVKNEGYWGAGLYIDNKSALVMREGASIRENSVFFKKDGSYGGSGGGVYLLGSLTMRDTSVISGNAALFGGGIYIDNTTVVMEDRSAIKDNKAVAGIKDDGTLFGGFGGGINVGKNGKLTMKGESSLAGNSGLFGGGLRVFSTAQAALEGRASITGNEARRNTEQKYGGSGGGVYVNTDGTITLKDSTAVRDNNAFWGGGIDLYGVLVLEGKAAITGNTVGAYQGGGVYVNANEGGVITGDESLISGNEAAEGADIYTTK